MSRSRNIWTFGAIEAAKRSVKEQLDAVGNAAGTDARLEAALRGVAAHSLSMTPEAQLQTFVYAMSALVHHERMGGLKDRQVAELTELADAVLKVASAAAGAMGGAADSPGELGLLAGELSLVRSQLFRKSGQHWPAFWEQQLGAHLARRHPPGGAGFQALSLGIRAKRLGHVERAAEDFRVAEETGLTEMQSDLARVNRIRCLRLAGDFESARGLLTVTEGEGRTSEGTRLELEWEAALLALASDHNPGRLVRLVKARQPHHLAAYVTEAFLWVHALGGLHWLPRLPKMETIGRKTELKTKQLGFFFKAVLTLEEAHDDGLPLTLRLAALGQVVRRLDELLTIDRELLYLVAAARWLARHRLFALARAVLDEYRGLSLKMTSGRSTDVLQVTGDLYGRPWFAGPALDEAG